MPGRGYECHRKKHKCYASSQEGEKTDGWAAFAVMSANARYFGNK